LVLGFGVALPVTADFRPLGDAAMASVTGQAGVIIEMATKIRIGQLTYQDEGRLNVDNIRLSGQDEVLDFELATTASAAFISPTLPSPIPP